MAGGPLLDAAETGLSGMTCKHADNYVWPDTLCIKPS